ncbi:MAG: HAMP domain-containing histidine kinase [Oscillospiraceae bacterium]|nr:HAMP domain-containing histidine kinase [Oscillospiraceae bacterium]
MKKYAWIYAILAVIILAGFILFSVTRNSGSELEPNYIAMNEIAKLAELHWGEFEPLGAVPVSYRYIIIDNDGIVLFSSDSGLPDGMPAAIRRGFVPVDVVQASNIVGKALIEVYPGGSAQAAHERLARAAIAMFSLMAALNLVFLAALHNALVKPFKRMQSFAHKITTGRLDEPLPMDRNNLFGLFTQSFDVMRESLLEERQSRMQAERAKKELIASLNHDVKTPVTSIRLISELLQTGAADRATIEKLKTIEMKADQIDRLMNDMMHSALEELGELKVAVASEDSAVLREVFDGADHLSKVRMGDIPSCLLDMDRARMEQVVGNIIANSFKYAGTDIDVEFALRGELLHVNVNDFGGGVDPEELELITTKFYRGENAKVSAKEGEGLGLYIAKLLMDKMGGGLEAFNREDGFTVRLMVRLSR